MVREDWGGSCVFNSFSSQARGVAIFLKKDSTAKIVDKYTDTDGNILAILIIFQEKRILLQGLYGPNTDSPLFYSETAFKKILEWQPEYTICGGDFNLVLDPEIDAKNYLNVNNPQARQELIKQMGIFNLVDIWRELNPGVKKYSWRKYNENKQSRLDFFLVSSSLLPYVKNADIKPGFCSDHSCITLDIDFSKFKRGKGFWKFNCSLLKDPEYVAKVKDTIKRVVAQYAVVNNDKDFYIHATEQELQDFYSHSSPESLQSTNLKINPQSFLDILLLEIRRETLTFSARRKRERIAKELLLLHEIEVLENTIAMEDSEEAFRDANAALQTKKRDLEIINEYQAQGAFVRARSLYKIEGERPTKLFCSLEKHNAIQKYIPKLKVIRGEKEEVITEQKLIENEILDFYEDIFSAKSCELKEINEFLSDEISYTCPKLSDIQSNQMEGLLTLNELTKYMKKTKNNVAPGSSGYTNEFFKFFWIDLKIFIVNSINHSYELGMLSVTQRLGIITLIPKGEKDKTYLKNWRPLTLLNSLYKLVSGCIAERMKPHLDTIIHGDQKGFVSERYIGEAIRTTYDIIQWAKENNRIGIILLIDFKKAYDSLSFSYIKKCLKFLNFGESIVKWVDLLLHNFSAVINHCGNISKRFNISRGARQGDPIASYLFIICIEILAHKLRNDPNIQGFQFNNQIFHTLELYADDCSIFLEPDEQNLRNAMKTLDSFFKLSGLKISLTKTKAIWFGKGYNGNTRLCQDLKLDWTSTFTLLGIEFDNNLEHMDKNFDKKLEDINKMLNCWINRTLTVYGKITVIKTMALSKLSHLVLVLPEIDKSKFKRLENLFFKFIWGDKPDKVSRDHVKLSEKAGGLGMVDIVQFWTALKLSWLRRLIKSKAFWPIILELNVQKQLGKHISSTDLLQLGPNLLTNIGKKFCNNFWKQVFIAISSLMQGAIFCSPEKILMSPFWDNSNILRNNRPIKTSAFPVISSKLKTIADFYINGTNIFASKHELERKYDIEISEENLRELHYIITTTRQRVGVKPNVGTEPYYPTQPLLINILNLTKTGCIVYYRLLRKKQNLRNDTTDRETRWHNELGTVYGVDFWAKTYFLAANIKFENRIKWLQFQINRNSLFTNYKVNKFKPNISPLCTFCGHQENFPRFELVSHLFYDCDYILNLWQNIRNWLATLGTIIPLERAKLLFGVHNEQSNSVINYIILSAKSYIWKAKFTTKNLALIDFQKFLYHKLSEIKNIFNLMGKENEFESWNVIYNFLSRLPECIASSPEATVPPYEQEGLQREDQPPT